MKSGMLTSSVQPWSHLPNAGHIDRILVDLKHNPDNWSAAWDTAWDAVRGAAAWDAARDTARDAAWDAILALTVWDHASSYLSLTPDKIKVLAALGDNIAVLMLPAVTALSMEGKND